MSLAIPIFRSRISPVFDFSTKALIIDIEQGKETERHEIDLAGLDLQGKVKRLKDVRVITLICVGISLLLHKILAQAGLEILPGIVGSKVMSIGFLLQEQNLLKNIQSSMRIGL